MKSVATTLVREAKFDTTDFATAKIRGCEGFTLLVSRTRADSCDGWFGAFQRGDERLDVIGHLEYPINPPSREHPSPPAAPRQSGKTASPASRTQGNPCFR